MDEEKKVVRVVGDLRAIEELAPSCKDMTHGASFTLRDLDYNDVVAELPEEGSKTCTLKFLGPELQHDLAAWLLPGSRMEQRVPKMITENMSQGLCLVVLVMLVVFVVLVVSRKASEGFGNLGLCWRDCLALSSPGEDLAEQSGSVVQARVGASGCCHDFVGREQQREPAEHLALGASGFGSYGLQSVFCRMYEYPLDGAP